MKRNEEQVEINFRALNESEREIEDIGARVLSDQVFGLGGLPTHKNLWIF